jgi:MinD-like ATPase involved in chromosome partitioning or flagellar assembly
MEQRGETADESGALPHVFVFSSGQQGIGKTWLVANLGALLARDGLRVLMIDSDQESQEHRSAGLRRVEERLWLLSSRSLPEGATSQEFDVVLIDAGAGADASLTALRSPAFRSVIVLTGEPGSIAAAYGVVSFLRHKACLDSFSVIVNQVADGREAREALKRLGTAADQTLDIQLDYLGHVARDENFTRAVVRPKSLVNSSEWPETSASASLELLAKRLRESCAVSSSDRASVPGIGMQRNMKGFWRTLVNP